MPSKGERGDPEVQPVLERPSNPSPQLARAATKHEKLHEWSPVLDTIRDKITKYCAPSLSLCSNQQRSSSS